LYFIAFLKFHQKMMKYVLAMQSKNLHYFHLYVFCGFRSMNSEHFNQQHAAVAVFLANVPFDFERNYIYHL
jgi:hypothetical protein